VLLSFIIGGVYIPPQSPSLIYKTHIEYIVHIVNEYPGSSFDFVVIIIYLKYLAIEILTA